MRARQAVVPALVLGAVALAVSGCDDFRSSKHQSAAAVPATAPAPAPTPANPASPAAPTTTATAAGPVTTPATADATAGDPSAATLSPAVAPTALAATTPMATSIENAKVGGGAATAGKPSPLLIKVEVLLDRAHFSPGVIDGRPGGNLTNAISAYARTHGLSDPKGAVTEPLLSALTAQDRGAITQTYQITPGDEAGPFIGKVPVGFVEQSKLPALGYTDPAQELSEKFHMSTGLLKALNPGADFTKAGTTIIVVQPGVSPLPKVARVEVDKAANQVRALDGAGKILAAFPATVGSTERPAPSGEWAVKAVAPHPDYTYDPKKLTFGPASKGVLTIKPGPNNPVGSTWIALTKESYGIHGTPDPSLIGKVASHGCVRLTNWDAAMLGKAVTKGTPVIFVGQTTKA